VRSNGPEVLGDNADPSAQSTCEMVDAINAEV
jgi:hypothetical protein